MQKSVFGNTFDLVTVINLDRRPDRMSSVRQQLAQLGMAYARHPATDGKAADVARDWQEYMQSETALPDALRRVENWRDFYLGDKPHASRVAYFEAERQTRAISTPGAWGLLRSMRRIIEKALAAKVGSLLILEDDVRFHRDTIELWPKIASELPDDWQIFQLGAMQLHWEDNWIDWHSQHLYKCNGSSFAAHAVALKPKAMRAIMERSKVFDLPFDIGALQEAKRMFRGQCYTAYPNLVVQDATDSEIGMSSIFETEARKAVNKYRWNWKDYAPHDLRPYQKPVNKKPGTAKGPAKPVTGAAYLQPYSAALDAAERIIVVFGPKDSADADAFITMLSDQKSTGEIAPIVVVDDMAHFPALRAAGLAFEYVPTLDGYRRTLRQDSDPQMVIERRLATIRRKWAPRRIIALGATGHDRLKAWRASPFEQAHLGADLASDDDLRGPAA